MNENDTPNAPLLYNQQALPTAHEEQTKLNEQAPLTNEKKPVPSLQFPEDLEHNVEDLSDFQTLVSELDISEEKAQKLLDFVAQKSRNHHLTEAEKKLKEKQNLIETAQKDAEFGQHNFNASLQLAQDALHQFGDEKLFDLLEEKDLGDHPEVIRLFYKIGKTMREDQFTGSHDQNNPSSKTLADILYS